MGVLGAEDGGQRLWWMVSRGESEGEGEGEEEEEDRPGSSSGLVDSGKLWRTGRKRQ